MQPVRQLLMERHPTWREVVGLRVAWNRQFSNPYLKPIRLKLTPHALKLTVPAGGSTRRPAATAAAYTRRATGSLWAIMVTWCPWAKTSSRWRLTSSVVTVRAPTVVGAPADQGGELAAAQRRDGVSRYVASAHCRDGLVLLSRPSSAATRC